MRIYRIGLFALLIAAITGLTLKCDSPNSKREQIVIADASQPVFSLLYIADAKGYFVDEGLYITYNYFTSGRDALNSVLSGQSEVATVYETPVVIQSLQGKALKVLSTLHTSTQNTGLVARRDRGITKRAILPARRLG